MYGKERERTEHLMILLCYTIFTIVLTGETFVMGWEKGVIMLLLMGLVMSWTIHITGKFTESIRLWLYFILTMLTCFFYGIHETSIYDLAPLMIMVIIMYSGTEVYSIINLCVATYYFTMGYDFIFVLGGSVKPDALMVTRTLLHLLLVYVAGHLVKSVIHRRVTERKHTEEKIEELEETNRRTEDFLTNVSHELRTPINAVTGMTAMMLKNEEDSEKRKDIIAVQSAGHRLFHQIEDILDYTEIDTGRIRVSEEVYMISSIVNDIISGERIWGQEGTPEVIFDVDGGIPVRLLGDGRKIKKIIKHLVDNAVKFTEKGGVYVRIYALQKAYGVNLCIRVSDTGIGISEENIEKITEKFYQSNGGRNRRAGGLGLGLSIVYGMVAELEGFIQIQSTVGKGTTVSVSIPQKVSDFSSCMVVENQEVCLACFLRLEKYEVPEVRDYYNGMISHLVQELSVTLHRVSDLDELKKLVSMYHLTHLFMGKEEYEEIKEYIDSLEWDTSVIVMADRSFVVPENSRIKLLRKPFDSLSVVNLLNSKPLEKGESMHTKRMICPGVRVLVVDDEPMNLMVAEGIFKEYQMSVTTAKCGRDAISLCEAEDFDIIFLDHMMPEMDGVETLKLLRKIHKDSGKAFTVIAFTANAVSGAREMFRQEGFDEFVSKPIEVFELERVLKKVLPKSFIAYADENHGNRDEYEKEKPAANLDHTEKTESTEELTQETSSTEEQIKNLEKEGFHTTSALRYCQGDNEFYRELLVKFAEDAVQKEAEIEQFYEKKDLENYRIKVHALKSTSRMVGADSLSENAKCAEEAAKNQDTDYITEHHEELLALYRKNVQKIKEVLGLSEGLQEQQENGTEISGKELIRQLKELKDSFDTFEADKSEGVISQMSNYRYQGSSVAELLTEVQNCVENFEFDAASGKVQELIYSVEESEQEVET